MKGASGGPRQGAGLFLPSVLGTGGASGRVGAERAYSSGRGWAGGCQMHAVGRSPGPAPGLSDRGSRGKLRSQN